MACRWPQAVHVQARSSKYQGIPWATLKVGSLEQLKARASSTQVICVMALQAQLRQYEPFACGAQAKRSGRTKVNAWFARCVCGEYGCNYSVYIYIYIMNWLLQPKIAQAYFSERQISATGEFAHV